MSHICHPTEFEDRVSAKSLFPYIKVLLLTYEAWIASLPHWPYNKKSASNRYRITESGGELYLNVPYAFYYLLETDQDFIAAMGMLLIKEATEGKHGDGPDRVSRVLDTYSWCAENLGRPSARKLHAFLEIETDYDRWITGLKKQYGMKPKKDYMWIKNKTDGRQMIFGPGFTTKVMIESQTPRGQFIREFITWEEM